MKSFDKAVELDAKYSSAYFNKGVALSKLGRDKEAADSYKKAVRFDPDNAQAHFNLGITLQKMNCLNEAEE